MTEQVLQILRQHGPLTISDLATRARVHNQTARECVAKLREKGQAHLIQGGRWARWSAHPDWRESIRQASSVWDYAERCR